MRPAAEPGGRHGSIDLADKVAIVTGGGQGIGGAISSRFAAEGARVVIAQRSQHVAQARVETIRAAGGQAFAVRTDVSDRAHLRALVARTVEAYGPPDILVNNAGVFVADDPLRADRGGLAADDER